jgi:hypothetical protein
VFYTIEDVLADSKRSEFYPVTQNTLTDPDLIAFANDALRMKIFPFVKSKQQHFYAAHVLTALKNNVAHYAIPERAGANCIENLWFVPDYLNQPNVRQPMTRVEKSNIVSWTGSTGRPSQFYLEGDEIWLVPGPVSLQGNERIYWDILERPSELVASSGCAKIVGVATVAGTTTFTVNTDLTASLSVGSKIDLLSTTSPFRLWAKDIVITAITATTVAVAATDVQDESGATEPVVGDYVCPAQQANVPMMPQELRPVLAELINYRALKALGAAQKSQACAAYITDLLSGGEILIESRVEDQAEVIFDRFGLLNSVGSFGCSNVVR